MEEEFETFQGGERRDSVIEGCSHVNEEGMGCFNGVQLHVHTCYTGYIHVRIGGSVQVYMYLND